MGRFNDLPSDVKWLIFRTYIMSGLRNCVFLESFLSRLTEILRTTSIHHWEEGSMIPNSLNNLAWSFVLTSSLAMIDKSSLKIIRSKCYRISTLFALQTKTREPLA